MPSLESIKSLLGQYGLLAKKYLGQNFLVDDNALELIVESAALQPEDTVVEIGSGTGFLTERLIEKVCRLIAVEYDEDMVRILNDRFSKTTSLELVHSDALQFRTTDYALKALSYKVVANIPYYITSPLIKHFLQSDCPPSLMILLVQKEVAEKVCGITGKSLITIETQLYGEPEIVGLVPSSSFYPVPKVDSAILKINVFDEPTVSPELLKPFLRLVKFGFSQKRKKLSNTLSAGLRLKTAELKGFLDQAGIDPGLRAERLSIEDWKRLTEILTKNGLLLE